MAGPRREPAASDSRHPRRLPPKQPRTCPRLPRRTRAACWSLRGEGTSACRRRSHLTSRAGRWAVLVRGRRCAGPHAAASVQNRASRPLPCFCAHPSAPICTASLTNPQVVRPTTRSLATASRQTTPTYQAASRSRPADQHWDCCLPWGAWACRLRLCGRQALRRGIDFTPLLGKPLGSSDKPLDDLLDCTCGPSLSSPCPPCGHWCLMLIVVHSKLLRLGPVGGTVWGW